MTDEAAVVPAAPDVVLGNKCSLGATVGGAVVVTAVCHHSVVCAVSFRSFSSDV